MRIPRSPSYDPQPPGGSGLLENTPPVAPDTRRIVRSALVTAAVATLAAALAGWLVGGATAPRPAAPAPAAATAVAGPVSIATPGDWAVLRSVPGVPGLDPDSTVSFAPVRGLRAYAVATVAPVDHPSLLPPALRALLTEPLPSPRRADLLGHAAWRYEDLPIARDRIMEVTAVPTTAGTLTLSCVSPRVSWSAAVGCWSDVRSVSLRGGATWVAPAADVALRSRLPGATAKLDRARVDIRAALRGARTPRGQSRLYDRLAGAYERAAAMLAPVAPSRGPAAQLMQALRGSAAAHRRLAATAAARNPRGYRKARRSVRRSDAALARALAKF